jgi:hypothetical protein
VPSAEKMCSVRHAVSFQSFRHAPTLPGTVMFCASHAGRRRVVVVTQVSVRVFVSHRSLALWATSEHTDGP